MTNKEAIKIITIVKGLITNDNSYSDETKPAIREAFNLAIKALRRADCIYIKDECLFACGDSGTCDAEEEGEEDDT